MSSQSEVGISPVLLQAITQTLSTNAGSNTEKCPKVTQQNGEGSHRTIVLCDSEGNITQTQQIQGGKVVNHILAGMNEPVAKVPNSEPETQYVVVENMEEECHQENATIVKQEVIETEQPQYIIKHVSSMGNEVAGSQATSDMNMGSVLSAIASHLKNNRKRKAEDSNSHEMESEGQPIVIQYAQQGVPDAVNDITVSDVDNVTETVIQTSASDMVAHDDSNVQVIEVVSDNSNGTLVWRTSKDLGKNTLVQNSDGTLAIVEGPIPDGMQHVQFEGDDSQIGGACPICGDRISGYHYGIYSCESCKGFFKRTVQNKKAFICHRKGECTITVHNRKKCPACRFKRCLVAGMRLEAIRTDRTRGGRSSYEGCSPHGRPGTSKPPTKRETGTKVVISGQTGSGSSASGSRTVLISPTSTGSGQNLMAMLTTDIRTGQEGAAQLQPQTPRLLEDLLTVESLMSEDEGELACCEGKLSDDDQDLFGSLLHIADHCLYKIVRWARNLPDFANVSTDDQILLLQNCWAELLCVTVCWHSIHCKDVLKLTQGRTLDIEMAKAMGVAEVVQRLIDFTEQMQRLEIDSHEFVALKVLLLLTPDVNGLKDSTVVRDYQERLTDCLLIYTNSHYPDKPNKFPEMIVRLPELSRTCILGKELLTRRQAMGEVPQFSLLSELLKGDVAVQAAV